MTRCFPRPRFCIRHDGLYLADIVEASEKIGDWLEGVTLEQWMTDEIRRSGVLWQLVIIGEAASSLSQDTRESLPHIPWRQVRGFRNKAVHQYFGMDWEVVWATAREDIAGLGADSLAFLRIRYPDLARRFDTPDQPSA